MEKKKLNFATIEAAIKNEAIEINEKNEEEIFALIITDRINHKKNHQVTIRSFTAIPMR